MKRRKIQFTNTNAEFR